MSNTRTREELIRPFMLTVEQYNAQPPDHKLYVATGGYDVDENHELAMPDNGLLRERARISFQDKDFFAYFYQGQPDILVLALPFPNAFTYLNAEQLECAIGQGCVALSTEDGFTATGVILILMLEQMTLGVLVDAMTFLLTVQLAMIEDLNRLA